MIYALEHVGCYIGYKRHCKAVFDMPSKKRKRCNSGKALVPCATCKCKLYPDCRVEDFFGDVMLCECINGDDGTHKEGIGPSEQAGPAEKAGRAEKAGPAAKAGEKKD